MMTRTVELSRVGIWSGVADFVPSAEAQGHASLLEELGYETLWIPETVGRDPFITASQLLSATERLVVATGVASIYARDAVTMANTARTLDEAFPGRFLLGIGVSHAHVVDGLRHHEYSKPYSAMVHYLDEMDAAAFNAVGPTDRPTTLLAALGPKMVALAGERADGVLSYFVTVEHTRQARERLGTEPVLAVEQMAVLGANDETGRQVARKGIAPYLKAPNYVNNVKREGFTDEDIADGGSDRLLDAIVVIGDEEMIVDRVNAHVEAGASHVCVQMLASHYKTVPTEAWRGLARALRAAPAGASR